MLAFSGRSLEWHCKEYFSVRFALLYGQYDYCMIQQYGHPFPGYEKTKPYLDSLVRLCRSVGTKPVLVMTWAKKEEQEAFVEIEQAYRILASELDLPLVSIGKLFQTISNSHPEIDLYRHDGAHASPYGSYLIAVSLAAFLLHPENLSLLSDRSFDFHVRKEPDGLLSASESRDAIPFSLNPESADILRKAVEQSILQRTNN